MNPKYNKWLKQEIKLFPFEMGFLLPLLFYGRMAFVGFQEILYLMEINPTFKYLMVGYLFISFAIFFYLFDSLHTWLENQLLRRNIPIRGTY